MSPPENGSSDRTTELQEKQDSSVHGPLDTIERVAKILALIAIPVLVALGAHSVELVSRDRDLSREYVQLSLTILQDSDAHPALRLWAVDLLSKYSPVEFSGSLEQQLIAGEITLPRRTSVPQCDDGIDNDRDGLIDYPADTSCANRLDNNEWSREALCGNGIREAGEDCDDGNSRNGDGCSTECNTTTQCNDGIDNDGDGLVDYVDIDGDGFVDEPGDPSCDDAADNNEWPKDDLAPICSNFIVERGEQCDDGNLVDGDGCSSRCKNTVQCWDKTDNDGDGLVDLADPDCEDSLDDHEHPEGS